MKNEARLKIMDRAAVGITVIILFIVGMMRRVKIETDIDFGFLPPFHSTLNALAAIALIVALVYIKKGNADLHRKAIYVALILSAGFLISYVVYHFTTEETRYCGNGLMRKVYFFFLISHVILAGVILPFIMFAFNRAYNGFYEKHKKMVKWVYPLWLYVAVSGPICYLMLRPCYG